MRATVGFSLGLSRHFAFEPIPCYSTVSSRRSHYQSGTAVSHKAEAVFAGPPKEQGVLASGDQGNAHFVSCFTDEIAAVEADDEAAGRFCGGFARLNDIVASTKFWQLF